VNSSLTATDHISYLLNLCSILLYVLQVLTSQCLKVVFYPMVISRMIHCVPEFCLASDYMQLNSFLCHAVKLGYCDKPSTTSSDLFQDADEAFFGV